MVRVSKFKSEDLGLDPLVGAGYGTVFLSLRVKSRADLFVPDPPFVCTAHPQICAHLHFKDPVSICDKRVFLTAGGMETRKHDTQGEKGGG